MIEIYKMRQVPDSELKNRLRFDNPWWESGKVDTRFDEWPRRAYFNGFVNLVTTTDVHRAVVLMGPRRVGKTVMIQQTIQSLLENGIEPAHILYVSVDTPVYTGQSLEKLLSYFQELQGHGRDAELYVFFDEIQYHPEWEVHLKSLVDSYRTIRFIASGSAAAALKLKSRESGAGRFTDFILPPLTFLEFLQFQNLEDQYFESEKGGWQVKDMDGLNVQFIRYLNYGGFPEAVMEEHVRDDIGRYVASDIIDKVLLRDLPSLYGIADIQELNRLFTVLAYNTGQEVTIDGLSQSSNVSKNTIKKYIEYLEAAFLICRLPRLDQNAKRFKKQTRFKVYLTNPSLRAALFGAVGADDPEIGNIVETALVSLYAQSVVYDDLFYARWKTGEVDIVLSPLTFETKILTAIEIKWSDRVVDHAAEDLRSLISFCKRTETTNDVIVTTRTKTGLDTIGGIKVNFLPAAKLAYQDGKTLIEESIEEGIHPLTATGFKDS